MVHKIATKHPTYTARFFDWDMCTVAFEGETAVKERGDDWLPRLSSMDDNDYANYKRRALYYAVMSRTVKGLSGALMFKRPDIDGTDEAFDKILETVGVSGESLATIATSLACSFLKLGRAGILVDSDDKAEPFMAVYPAQAVINWKKTRIKGKLEYSMIVLEETIDINSPDDEYKVVRVKQYRKLFLKPIVDNGPLVYHFELWREPADPDEKTRQSKDLTLIDHGTPTYKNGINLDSIPFFLSDSEDTTGGDVAKPFLLDMVHISRSHYLNSADLEWGRHFTALPTAWAAGFDPNSTFRIGSSVAWVTENIGAEARYLEFAGTGLGHLASGMKDKEGMMAVLGARMLEEAPRHVESEGAAQIRQSGEQSVLVGVGKTLSTTITSALRTVARWLSKTENKSITYKMVTDFNFRSVSSDELAVMMLAVQSGLLSFQEFFKNLQRGGVVTDGVTMKEELAAIEAGGHALVGQENGPEPIPDAPGKGNVVEATAAAAANTGEL